MPHYCDNKTLTEHLSNWVRTRTQALASNTPAPPVPDAVAESAYLMAERLSRKPNFVHYTFRDDMVAYALLCVCTYCHNFDPEKSQNGFAYLTQIITNAFIRFIQSEGKQSYVKAKLSRELNASPTENVARQPNDNRVFRNTMVEHNAETALDIIATYENRVKAKKEKAKRTVKLTGQVKVCTRCNEEKDQAYFRKSCKAPDGRQGVCGTCFNLPKPPKPVKSLYKATPKTELPTVKYCNGCNALLALEHFYKKAHGLLGHMSRCKECWNKTYKRKKPAPGLAMAA